MNELAENGKLLVISSQSESADTYCVQLAESGKFQVGTNIYSNWVCVSALSFAFDP